MQTLYGIVIGVFTSIVATVIYSLWKGVAPHKRWAEVIANRRLLARIRRDYLGEFQIKCEPRRQTTQYYFRDGETYPDEGFGAPFALLSDPDIQLREFKAFLIPPLDTAP